MATRSSAHFGSTMAWTWHMVVGTVSEGSFNNSERRYALHFKVIGDRFVDLHCLFR